MTAVLHELCSSGYHCHEWSTFFPPTVQTFCKRTTWSDTNQQKTGKEGEVEKDDNHISHCLLLSWHRSPMSTGQFFVCLFFLYDQYQNNNTGPTETNNHCDKTVHRRQLDTHVNRDMEMIETDRDKLRMWMIQIQISICKFYSQGIFSKLHCLGSRCTA